MSAEQRSIGAAVASPGWYHAPGDGPGTHRWWDGHQWQGGPMPAVGEGYGARRPARPAGYGTRVVAALLDCGATILVGLAAFLVAAVLGATSEALALVTTPLALAGYFGFVVWNYGIRQGRTGQTIGKRQERIRLVADGTGQPCGVGLALVRWILPSVGGWFSLGLLPLLDVLWPLWDGQNKRLIDKILRLSVVTID